MTTPDRYMRDPGAPGASVEFKEWNPVVRAQVSGSLLRIPKKSVFSPIVLRSLLAVFRGYTVQVGDLDHALYVIAGFVAEESTKHRHSTAYSLDFLAAEGAAFLAIDARLFQPGKAGSTMYGMWIYRVAEEVFLISNSVGPAA